PESAGYRLCRGFMGRSVHSVAAAKAAEIDGAEYVVAGSVLETDSHPGQKPIGLAVLASIWKAVRVPVLAIGGIRPDRVGDCVRAGARGIAVLSEIMDAYDAKTAARNLRAALVWPPWRMTSK